MNKLTITSLSLLLKLSLCTSAFAATPSIEDNIKRLNWNGIDVVYIEDDRFPTYDMTIYFADGALSDKKDEMGLTVHSFGNLDSGTPTLSQKDILDQLEFYGTGLDSDVTHEYTTVAISGLSKDLNTSMTHICSLFRETSYPQSIVQKELAIEKNGLLSLVSAPQALAERVFREISLSDTPYAYPVSGKIKDFNAYSSEALKTKMNYFLDNVKKRIYLTGPKNILSVEKILTEKCGFKGSPQDFVRSLDNPKSRSNTTEFVFVPVADANQVQLRVGRFLNASEADERNLDALAADFLGGGFTSKLMREVRVKRGLTYSIGAYISTQKQYGRSGISTFTKNETIDRLIEVIDQTVTKIATEGVKQEELNLSLEGLIGGYPFRFESNRAFLAQLLYLDHIGKPYSDLFEFKEAVKKYTPEDVSRKIRDVFSLKKQVIFVLGDKRILPKLKKLEKKYGKLKIVDFKPFI